MHRPFRRSCSFASLLAPLVFGLLVCFPAAAEPAAPVPPAFAWRTATPESQGLSSTKLDAFWKTLEEHHTTGLLVIRNDRIVFERYTGGFSATKPHGTASMAKALVGGMSLTVAMSDGLIGPDDLACQYVPQWSADPLKSKIKIRHLATHTSGIEDAEQDDIAHEKLTGWKGAFWARTPDPFTISRDLAPVLYEPGTSSSYSNPGMAMLSYCITASLKDASQKDVRSLLKERVLEPIGVQADEWTMGYGTTYDVDGLPLVANWGGAAYTARATARVGRLMLRQGDWEGVQLVKASVVEQVLREGLGWWNNHDQRGVKRLEHAFDDAFWGAGAGHQLLYVVPSLNMVVVRNGATLDTRLDYNVAKDRFFFEPLMQAVSGAAPAAQKKAARKAAPQVNPFATPEPSVTSEPSGKAPVPPSPVIKGVRWAPKASIVRQAKGCDNWPMTWGDDDALYTAYGDGNGFEPFLPEKVSLGFVRVTGDPTAFQGENVRSASGEAKGNDYTGLKASGLLMIDGTLYMLARNAGNAKLAWSTDHARTWNWSDWKFTTSFGYPTFLNFGKNYAGARDHYVYVYSQDADSAYVPADGYVMARAPKDRLREQGAWEYFAKLGADGQPVWTRDVAARGRVFSNPGRCYRSSVSYDAGLKRYLWCQILAPTPEMKEPRFKGGFAIYDAPEPWGPWTTVYHTDLWDVGPGETNCFPTKWMSPDGRRVFLVFSGDDHFSVREAELIVK